MPKKRKLFDELKDGVESMQQDRDGKHSINMTLLAPIQNCEFKYKCPKDWFDLDDTDNENIRYCRKCSQNVYFCESDKDLQKSIKLNRCVAIFRDGPDSPVLLGLPGAPNKN